MCKSRKERVIDYGLTIFSILITVLVLVGVTTCQRAHADEFSLFSQQRLHEFVPVEVQIERPKGRDICYGYVRNLTLERTDLYTVANKCIFSSDTEAGRRILETCPLAFYCRIEIPTVEQVRGYAVVTDVYEVSTDIGRNLNIVKAYHFRQ